MSDPSVSWSELGLVVNSFFALESVVALVFGIAVVGMICAIVRTLRGLL